MSEKHPNGLWIWHLDKIRQDYLKALKARRCQRVYLKVFDDKSNNSEKWFWDQQCSEHVMSGFQNAGIEVWGWGYHFDQRTSVDVDAAIENLGKAVARGIKGYVFDVEKEVKNSAAHGDLRKLISGFRAKHGDFPIGYTSFGHPGFHPDVPWQLLDALCDYAFPQIYFEKWHFGSSDADEVQRALAAHRELGLKLPILPIWGSEEDARQPATAARLQRYLGEHGGSSIFRAPNRRQQGEAWSLFYDGRVLEVVDDDDIVVTNLGPFPGLLKRGSKGTAVEQLQRALRASGYSPGPIDGIFGLLTQRAVREFQLANELTVDGLVGPITWGELAGYRAPDSTGFRARREELASIAEEEGRAGNRWVDANSEAEKYLAPFREPMRERGHIGNRPVFYNWCAAFVAWCTRKAGFEIPNAPQDYYATMALVQAWKEWGKQTGTWHDPNSTEPERGDIVCFEWFDGDTQLDHIGIVRSYTSGSSYLETSEGNRNNMTKNGTRKLRNIKGIIRLRNSSDIESA